MSLLPFLLHVTQFFLPALAVAALSAAGVRLLWPRRTRAVGYWRLAGWSALSGAAVWLAVLIWTDTDGTMPGYALLVLSVALTQAVLTRRKGS